MNVSRKDFFRRGLLYLGSSALDLASAMNRGAGLGNGTAASLAAEPAAATTASNETPLAGAALVAVAIPTHCLARGCGCFGCLDCCEAGAITLSPGLGILIDAALCTGCGVCRECCPTTPKSISMVVAPGRSPLL